MGFMDFAKATGKVVGEIGVGALNSMVEQQQKIEEYKETYRGMSDDRLKKEFMRLRNGGDARKILACRKVCEERGLI